MLGFPIPHPEELVYSLVARAGVHSGILSPKQLLDDVYANRKIIATVDLSSHLTEISNQYPLSLNITVSSLIYQHTLFPIYAPFIVLKSWAKLKIRSSADCPRRLIFLFMLKS